MNDDARSTRRSQFEAGELRIGGGELGGKANGLVFFNTMLAAEFDPSRFPDLTIAVPPFAVIGTGVYDEFLDRNELDAFADSAAPDEEIARAFLKGTVPEGIVADVRALLAETDAPLAVRSSSLMEDAIFRPFAGVYATKMVPGTGREWVLEASEDG